MRNGNLVRDVVFEFEFVLAFQAGNGKSDIDLLVG
jgi:hypothetical protein